MGQTSPGLKKLTNLASLLVAQDKEMTMTRLSVLLFIARNEKCLVRDVVDFTGLNQSTIARLVHHLGDKPLRGMKGGLNWVEVYPDHIDPRRVRLKLTAEGKSMIKKLEEVVS